MEQRPGCPEHPGRFAGRVGETVLTLTSAATGVLFLLATVAASLRPASRWSAKWLFAAALLTGGPAVLAAVTGFALDDPERRGEILFQAVLFNLAAGVLLFGLAGLERRVRRLENR